MTMNTKSAQSPEQSLTTNASLVLWTVNSVVLTIFLVVALVNPSTPLFASILVGVMAGLSVGNVAARFARGERLREQQ